MLLRHDGLDRCVIQHDTHALGGRRWIQRNVPSSRFENSQETDEGIYRPFDIEADRDISTDPEGL